MANSSARSKAIIVGGSLGGLFAANLLVRNGWDVDVFERVPVELAARGAAIVTHPELFAALAAARIEFDDSIGVMVQSRVTFAQNGMVLSERELPQTLTAWGKMHHVLRAALPDAHYHSGGTVLSVENGPDQAAVTINDGTVLHADLVIAADAFTSSIRARFLPEVKLQFAGYVAWRGLVDEASLSPQTRAALFEKFAFYLINRPGAPFVGAAKASMGPTAGALGNAWFDATGKRLRQMPPGGDNLRRQIDA